MTRADAQVLGRAPEGQRSELMPLRAAIVLIFIAGVLLSAPVSAQTPPDPPGPYVVDLRGATGGLPDTDFFPTLPRGTAVPSRGFGFDVGGHVYPLTIGGARVGLGVDLVRVRGTASTVPTAPVAGSPTPTTPAPVFPDVVSVFTTVAPQVSFNFGTVDGWSYLSAGVGRGSIETQSTLPAGTAQVSTTPATRSSGSVMSINYGGGARWFLRRHVAVGFDVRFHRLSAGGNGTGLATPGTRFFAASVGLSLR